MGTDLSPMRKILGPLLIESDGFLCKRTKHKLRMRVSSDLATAVCLVFIYRSDQVDLVPSVPCVGQAEHKRLTGIIVPPVLTS